MNEARHSPSVTQIECSGTEVLTIFTVLRRYAAHRLSLFIYLFVCLFTRTFLVNVVPSSLRYRETNESGKGNISS